MKTCDNCQRNKKCKIIQEKIVTIIKARITNK